MSQQPSRYRGYRFPPEIIAHALWFYHRFGLRFRDVEDLLAERAVGGAIGVAAGGVEEGGAVGAGQVGGAVEEVFDTRPAVGGHGWAVYCPGDGDAA